MLSFFWNFSILNLTCPLIFFYVYGSLTLTKFCFQQLKLQISHVANLDHDLVFKFLTIILVYVLGQVRSVLILSTKGTEHISCLDRRERSAVLK